MKLRNPNYLAAQPKDRIAVVDGLIKKASDAAAATAAAAAIKGVGDKLVKGKAVASADDIAKLIDAERKAASDKVKELDGKLASAKIDYDGLMKRLKETTTALAEKEKMLTASLDREKALKATNDTTLKALKDVGAVVSVTVEDTKAVPALVKEVRELKRLEGIKDPKGELRKLEDKLATTEAKHKGEIETIREKALADQKKLMSDRAASEAKLTGERDVVRAELKNRWQPAEMLGHWLPVVEAARDRSDLAAKALRDADRVTKDPDATPAQKAQAQALTGLVARNREDYDAAKKTLTAALPALSGEWKAAAETALKRSDDPGSEIADRARELASQGKAKAALALLEKGIKASSGKKGSLYAQRGRIALEEARASGKVGLDDAMISAARKDADAAAKEGSAEGHYLAGRIAEETKQLAEAERHYREAIKAHGTLDEAGARYRAALARVLVRRSTADSTPRPVPPALRTGRLDVGGLSALLTLALYDADLPKAAPPTTEAEKLADEILAQGDKVSFDVRAQALAVKGLHTRAVRTYVLGLRDKGLLAPEHANALMDLVNSHPSLARPDTRTEPDPVQGEKYYAAGLRFFAGRRWADAEREFLAAVENDGGDARYHYYLGLARLAQGNRAGYEDFDRAAALERAGRPDRAAVSVSLERVQGPMRAILNAVRTRPPLERAR
jgi:tetratricopeptide (TPR) repeat protein